MKHYSARSKEKQNTSLQSGSIGTEDRGHFVVDFIYGELPENKMHFLVFAHSCLLLVIQKYRRSVLPVIEILPFLSLVQIIFDLVRV